MRSSVGEERIVMSLAKLIYQASHEHVLREKLADAYQAHKSITLSPSEAGLLAYGRVL